MLFTVSYQAKHIHPNIPEFDDGSFHIQVKARPLWKFGIERVNKLHHRNGQRWYRRSAFYQSQQFRLSPKMWRNCSRQTLRSRFEILVSIFENYLLIKVTLVILIQNHAVCEVLWTNRGILLIRHDKKICGIKWWYCISFFCSRWDRFIFYVNYPNPSYSLAIIWSSGTF